MARALGDRLMGEVLSREPTVYTIEIGAQSVIVLASDGLLDPDHAEVARLAEEMLGLRSRGAPFDAEALIGWAEERGLFDNATAVVWNSAGGETGAPSVSTSTRSS
jgi:serine/threonine protein phosphatase PrpC